MNIGGPGTQPETSFKTFDIEAPELEAFVRGGGINETSGDLRTVIGAELIESN